MNFGISMNWTQIPALQTTKRYDSGQVINPSSHFLLCKMGITLPTSQVFMKIRPSKFSAYHKALHTVGTQKSLAI